MFDVNNQRTLWFITGCSTGFGRALAKKVLEKGWRLLATARDASSISDLSQGAGDSVVTLSLDVTNQADIDNAVAVAHRSLGRIDVLVNNAGYGYQSTLNLSEESRPSHVQKVSGDNLLALLATADVVSIDGHEYARSLRGKAACELDEVTTDKALLDLIAVTPRRVASPQ